MEIERSNIYRAIATMMRVIYALILRETKTRYGRIKIGYLWAFLEPMIFITVLSLIFRYGRQLSSSEIPQILFYITGLLPFFLFRDVVNTTMLAVRQNSALLYYPDVQIFDLCVARALLELCTFVIIFSVFVTIIGVTGIEQIRIEDPLALIQITLCITLYGFSCGIFIGSIIPLFPSIEFLSRSLFILPMFWISGVFFTADIVPPEIRQYVLLNPLLHLIEGFRSAFFYEFDSTFASQPFAIGAILCCLFMGLLIQRVLRRYAFQT